MRGGNIKKRPAYRKHAVGKMSPMPGDVSVTYSTDNRKPCRAGVVMQVDLQ